jgi:hypothetical protein
VGSGLRRSWVGPSPGERENQGFRQETPDGLPVRSFQDLLDHFATLDRQTINFAAQRIEKITNPTPTQRRAFELIGTPIPLTLTDR